MFLHDNLLIVNLVGYGNYSDDDYITTVTSTEIYDVSNPEAPELVNKLSQSGYYSSSRMLGDMLYIVSQEYLDETNIIPYTEQNGSKEALPCSDICYTGEPSDASYVIISAINTQNGGKYSDTAAVFGGSSNIYCNEKNMYITSFERDASYGSLFGRGGAESIGMASTGTTHIIKLSLNGSEIRVTASGSVDGYTNNQFSMDEYEGNLRIAVTSSDITNSETDNSLYVLDENLNEIGKITDLAKGESIKAVRFSENIAYVITYEQTDPLFVIDLSNPASPTLLGSVEITGFSSMLIPLENGRILGVGYATSQSETGEALNGIKLVLFDVSDPTAPSVLSTKVFEDADSDAQYTHKALVVNSEKGYYAIPFNRYNESLSRNDSGAMTFTVENDKIVVTNIFINPVDTDDYSYTARCTFAGDYVYSLTSSPEIFAHEYK